MRILQFSGGVIVYVKNIVLFCRSIQEWGAAGALGENNAFLTSNKCNICSPVLYFFRIFLRKSFKHVM